MRIWADFDERHLPLSCVDISLCESSLTHLIAAVPECLVDFGVLICGANVTIPLGFCPSCDLLRGSQSGFWRSTLLDCLKAVCANAFSSWQVVVRVDVDVDVNCILLSLLGSGCTVRDLGFRTVELFARFAKD